MLSQFFVLRGFPRAQTARCRFIHNPVAVTGLSSSYYGPCTRNSWSSLTCFAVLIGVIGAAVVAFAIFHIRKRRKARNDDLGALPLTYLRFITL